MGPRRVLLTVVAVCAASLGVAAPAAAAESVVVAATKPPAVLAPGQSFTSELTVRNAGDVAAGVQTLKVTYPRTVSGGVSRQFVRDAASGATCSTYTPRYGSVVTTCTLPAGLAPGATVRLGQYSASAPVPVPYPYAGYGSGVTISGPTNASGAVFTWRQAGPPDLVGSVSVSPGYVLAGTGPVGVSGTIQDAGYGAAGPFSWHVALPAGATDLAQLLVVPATTCVPAGNGFDCRTTALANGATIAYRFSFTAPAAAGLSAVVTTLDTGAELAEASEANNTATAAVTVTGVAANLAVRVSNPATASQYSRFTRTVTVTNIGAAAAADAAFVDYATVGPFPLLSLTAVPAGVTCNRAVTWSGRPARLHYHGVACRLGALAPGASVSVPYDLVVPGLAAGSYLTTVTASTSSYVDPASTPAAPATIAVFVPAPPNPPLQTAAPVVSGVTTSGSVLAATTGTWIGAGTITYAYAWQRCTVAGTGCVAVPGASAATYALGAADVGSRLRVAVTATNAGGSTVGFSASAAAVIGSVPPVNTTAPALVPGLEKQPGFAWSVTTGTWSGTPTITYAYQWQRCSLAGTNCVDIAGATVAGYFLQTADVVHTVRVVVTATNPAGSASAVTAVSPEIDPPD